MKNINFPHAVAKGEEMIGGVVIEVIELTDKFWVNTMDKKLLDCRCAIYVKKNELSKRIRPNDILWWQGRFAMWSPKENRGKNGNKGGIDYDIRIPRIGYSGVTRPEAKP